MSTTITVPNFWTFRDPCSCPYGSMHAITGNRIIATEENAWHEFYGRQRDVDAAKNSGRYVTADDEFDSVRWTAAHDSPECKRGSVRDD